jgi:hypothetical protein
MSLLCFKEVKSNNTQRYYVGMMDPRDRYGGGSELCLPYITQNGDDQLRVGLLAADSGEVHRQYRYYILYEQRSEVEECQIINDIQEIDTLFKSRGLQRLVGKKY